MLSVLYQQMEKLRILRLAKEPPKKRAANALTAPWFQTVEPNLMLKKLKQVVEKLRKLKHVVEKRRKLKHIEKNIRKLKDVKIKNLLKNPLKPVETMHNLGSQVTAEPRAPVSLTRASA